MKNLLSLSKDKESNRGVSAAIGVLILVVLTLLLVSSVYFTAVNGRWDNYFYADAGGSGGSIQLKAPEVKGDGTLEAEGIGASRNNQEISSARGRIAIISGNSELNYTTSVYTNGYYYEETTGTVYHDVRPIGGLIN